MKKFGYLFLIISLVSTINAQKLEKFTPQEKDLIQTNSSEMMRVLNLKNTDDIAVLKNKSTEINPNNKLTKLLAKRMLLSVNDPNNKGVGIAAPQVGINRRMIVVKRFDKTDNPFEVFVNPTITWQSKLLQKGLEGDLSFDSNGLVMRNYAIQIEYQDLNGNTKTESMEGFTAVIFQHERDHLDGILLTDRQKEQENIAYDSAGNSSLLYFHSN